MISLFTPSNIDAIRCLLNGGVLSFPIFRRLPRGVVRGYVKFELVWLQGVAFIQRTYLPSSIFKKSSHRYVSLDAFFNEYSAFSSASASNIIDDLPFK